MAEATTPINLPLDTASLAGTLNALFMGFQVIGFDWKYLYVNAAAAGHGRSTPEALIGRTMFEAYPFFESLAFIDGERPERPRTIPRASRPGAGGREGWGEDGSR